MTSAELIPSLCAGSDIDVVNAARRSFDRWNPKLTEGDRSLIRFLAREGHLLPFRHPQLSFSCEAPMPVARQLGKHQVGMSWSEVSRRYKTENIDLERIEIWRSAPEGDRKQGSGADLPDDKQAQLSYLQRHHHAVSMSAYRMALGLGASPEQARYLLPQSMPVRWTWTGSLLSWAHVWAMRSHKDAQAETREFAKIIDRQIDGRLPESWAALREHYRPVPRFDAA